MDYNNLTTENVENRISELENTIEDCREFIQENWYNADEQKMWEINEMEETISNAENEIREIQHFCLYYN